MTDPRQDPRAPQARMIDVGRIPDLPAGGSTLYLAGADFTEPGLYVWTGSANVKVADLDQLSQALGEGLHAGLRFLDQLKVTPPAHPPFPDLSTSTPPVQTAEVPEDPSWLRRILGR